MQILYNKVVFLTGGTEGIGFECAKAYHNADAKLSILSNSSESLEKARHHFNGHHIHYILADVSAARDIEHAISETVAHELYNNSPSGYAGNEDCGQMSAWYIFSLKMWL